MNASEHLARQLKLALNGGAWHGPSWRETLEGITWKTAVDHPVTGAHSIAEIVLHTTTWHDVVRRRMEGETPQVSDAEDWPAADISNDTAWSGAVARLFETGNALAETMARFPVEKLHEPRPGLDDSWFGLLIGELQHVLYHCGQVPILKKAAAGGGK